MKLKTSIISILLFLCILPISHAFANESTIYTSLDNTDSNTTHIYDLSGNNFNGLITGADRGYAMKLNKGIYCNGGADNIAFGNVISDGNISICLWANSSEFNFPDSYSSMVAFGLFRLSFGITKTAGSTSTLQSWINNANEYTSTVTVTENQLFFACLLSDTTANTLKFYINNTLVGNHGGVTDPSSLGNLFYCGANTGTSGNYLGGLDEVWIKTGNIATTEEMDELWNNGDGLNPYEAEVDSSNLNTLFENITGGYKTTFKEGENFYHLINWTKVSDGTSINKSLGSCTTTLKDGIFENESSNTNFLLCDHPSCDYPLIEENFKLNSVINAESDFLRLTGCHSSFQTGSILIKFSCGTNSSEHIIEAGALPSCDDGNGTVFVYSDVCLNFDNLDLNISYYGGFNTRKRISEYEIDREFTQLTIPNDEYTYNSTSNLWKSNNNFEYYIHGTKQINTTCTGTSPEYTNYFNTTITIENIPPIIFIGDVLTSKGLFDIEANELIEFGFGNFTFFGSVVSNDIDTINVTIYNSSNDLIFSWEEYNSTEDQLNVSSELFRDFNQNSFNISVIANDSTGDYSFKSLLFNVTDSTAPVCLSFSDSEVLFNQSFNWNVTCTDESFFSLNVTCDNSFSFFEDGLNVQSYNFINSSIITNDTTCSIRYCDGHTLLTLNDDFTYKTIEEKVEITTNDVKNVFYDAYDNSEIVLIPKDDRLSFEFTSLDSKIIGSRTFYYETSANSYYFPSDKYKGWIVDSDAETWFDANIENDKKAIVEVTRLNPYLWRIEVLSTEPNLIFNSIGQLNCVSTTQKINTILPSTPSRDLTRLYEFSSIPQALTHIFLIGIWILLYVLTLVLTGRNGKTIQFLNILQMIIGLVEGYAFLQFSFLIGFPIIFIAVGTFVSLILYGK